MRAILAAALLLSAALASPAMAAEGVTLHVSPNGDDAANGRAARRLGASGPLKTIAGARDAIRAMKKGGALPKGGVTVVLAEGTYPMAAPVAFTAEDSGTPDAPIVYRAAAGAQVRVTGGRSVGGWTAVTDAGALEKLPTEARGKVMQTDLKAQGITDFGKLTRRGFGKPMTESHLELFFDDQPMTVARWPNGNDYARIAALPQGQDSTTFAYGDDRPARWVNEKDPWVFGYWYHDWADEYIPIKSIDPAAKTITLADPKPAYGFRNNQRFYGLNLFSELDSPGEFYLDRETGILYFWPPAAIKSSSAYVSVLPSLLNLDGVSNVTFRGLTLEGVRGTAVSIKDGANCAVVACTLRNIGNRAVTVSGGKNHGVVGCDITRTADGGISLSGGDRVTLTPCGHYADNNHIYNYSRWSRTYRPAIGVGGVGIKLTHNLLNDGQHNAIQLSGNDHLIEFNEIHSVAYDTGDVGAFYTGRDYTARGTMIRNNYFHHVQGPGHVGAMGVYLDDQASGFTITGNVFYKVTRAMFVGGGDDNIITNNVFIDCVPSIHIDARGLGWQKKATDDPKGELRTKLAAMPYKNELWSKRYPELVNIENDDPGMPKRNLVRHNVTVGGKALNIEAKGAAHQIVENNFLALEPSIFVNAAKGDFRLKPGSAPLAGGFQPIPVEKIGLYKNENRASWPVVAPPRELPQEIQTPAMVRTGAAPVAKVARTSAPLTVNGTITAAEWNGANTASAIRIEQDQDGHKSGPISLAWVGYDDQGLRIAIDNTVDPNATLRRGDTWGEDDAVEVAIRPGAVNTPIIVYRGFPSGTWLVTDESGAPAPVIAKAKVGVSYAAQTPAQGRWTAEWRIPWSALGVTPEKGRRLATNLTVRKTAGSGSWLMWQGTGGHSFRVENAAVLELGE